MREGHITFAGVVCLLALLTPGAALGSPGSTPEDEAVERAVRLLPRRPDKVVVVDVDGTPVLREKLGHTEAFVTDGLRIVYVRKQGRTLQLAVRKGGLSDYALAAIIWHEMAHLDGAREAEARRREEDLWMQFIVQRRVESAAGLAYLSAIRGGR
jgi:hypothetical protein